LGTQSQNPITTGDTSTTIAPAPTLVYPIDRFSERITVNDFGTYYPSGGSSNPDTKVCPGATYYVGYHTAVDLETFPEEQNTAVPAYAIADGVVRQIGPVSGYGGLIVIESTIKNAIYTIYYGHVDLSTGSLKVGDKVIVGQKIVELGQACLTSNGNVRKHLHFGIHKGTAIDDRGYVSNQTALSNWIDPKILF
jgi:murein DD-endopeptidase MepM/ murein hydrolase activator NlpD